jgi:tetratricopeptide (TPR) repeat protein
MVDAGERDPDIKKKLSEVIIMRSVSRQDVDERIEDLLKAIDADPENERAIQLTVESLASVGRNDEAEAVVRKFLETDPNNDYALRRLMLILVQAEKMDQASSFLNEKIEKHPELSVLYSLRSNLFLMKASTGNPEPQDRKGWLESGKADCDKAVELDAENLDAYLNRARICLALKDYDQAKKDLDYLQEKRPEIPDIAFLKMDLAIQEKRVGDAIAELERLVQLNPENRLLLMQLASMYQMDDRPRKALRIADRLINAEPTDWQALRLRGDVLLALGRHADAINDYEEAVKNIPEDEEDLSGVLNNLSWVLSTSPEDSVRNGDRALEAGLKACELTEYKKSHILSTLAAAYAELGQFDKAIEWSSKAVELGAKEEAEQLDQLKEELKNYQDKKPWREKKETEEKQTKPAKPDGGIDT